MGVRVRLSNEDVAKAYMDIRPCTLSQRTFRTNGLPRDSTPLRGTAAMEKMIPDLLVNSFGARIGQRTRQRVERHPAREMLIVSGAFVG